MESHASSSTTRAAEEVHAEMDGHELSDDEPMVDPTTGQKILRPRNAWILYRKTRLNDVAPLSDGSRQPMAKASSIISAWWKSESKEVRKKFEMMAAHEKAEHKRKYPDYKYKPRTSQQIAKAKEKKKTAKKTQMAKEKDRKAKAAREPPIMATSTMSSQAHTSYIAAALANQAAMQGVQFGPEGPSPPLSLASTPVTTPSPLPLSDFEQGTTSTTATSFKSSSSPADGLGLALAPSSFNFKSQEASLRAPRHVPARIPPRPRGGRLASNSTSASSRVPSSTVSPSIASPVTSTPIALSPFSWPGSSTTSQHSSPPGESNSLSADLLPPPTDFSWGNTTGPTELDPSESVSINLELPIGQDEFLSDLEYFNSMGLPSLEHEGVFQMSADSFLEAVPAQIDVNIPSLDHSDQDRERFAALLNDFDFSQFQGDSAPEMSNVQSMSSMSGWESWGTAQEESLPSVSAHGESASSVIDVTRSQVRSVSASSQSMQSSTTPAQQQSSHAQMQAQQAAVSPVDLTPDVLADPEFHAMFSRYLEQKQQQQQQSFAQPPQDQSQLLQGSIQAQIHQPLAQYAVPSHPQQQTFEPLVQSPYSPGDAQQIRYSSSEYANQPHSDSESAHDTRFASASSEPSTPASCSAPPPANRYVPPAGAVHSRTRRVAGSWRPAAAQQEAWSAPQTPVKFAKSSRTPPWAGVAD